MKYMPVWKPQPKLWCPEKRNLLERWRDIWPMYPAYTARRQNADINLSCSAGTAL